MSIKLLKFLFWKLFSDFNVHSVPAFYVEVALKENHDAVINCLLTSTA